MTPAALLSTLTRLTDIINDPKADNTAGRVDALKYDVLPKLLASEVGTVMRALREQVQKEGQPELFK